MFALRRCSYVLWFDSWLTRTSVYLFGISDIPVPLEVVLSKCLRWKPFWKIIKVWIRICYASKNLPNGVAFAVLQYQRAGNRLSCSKRCKVDFGATKTIRIMQIIPQNVDDFWWFLFYNDLVFLSNLNLFGAVRT